MLSAPSAAVATVHFDENFDTASDTVGTGDYVRIVGDLGFLPGEQTKTICVSVRNDAAIEPIEAFAPEIGQPINATVARSSARVIVTDNDTSSAAPLIAVRDVVVDETALENAGVVRVPVVLADAGKGTRSANAVTPVTVNYATSDAGAAAGSDYVATNGTLVFAPGETAKTIPVTVREDTTNEGLEQIAVTLSAPTGGATIADGAGLVSIYPNDRPVVVSPAVPFVSIGPDRLVDETAGCVEFTVALNAPSSTSVVVGYDQFAETATALADYNRFLGNSAGAGPLTFLPGEQTKMFCVSVLDDVTVGEPIESAGVYIGALTGATVARPFARLKIADNDTVNAAANVYARDAVVDEMGLDSAGMVDVPVALGGPDTTQRLNVPVTIDYTTVPLSASVGTDFLATSGTLTFRPRETVQRIRVRVLDDTANEGAERIGVVLSNPTGGAVLADPNAVIQIAASDKAQVANPTISLGVDWSAGEADTCLPSTVTLSAPSANPVTIGADTAPGTAFSNVDYNRLLRNGAGVGSTVFAPGETARTVCLLVRQDATVEGPETFFDTLGGPVGGTLGDALMTATIVDDDSGPRVFSFGISDDTYSVTATNDVIVENINGGTDLVNSTATFTLPAKRREPEPHGRCRDQGNRKLVGQHDQRQQCGQRAHRQRRERQPQR